MAPRPAPTGPTLRRNGARGSVQLRLRIGLVLIAMVVSLFAARLVQLQGIDPGQYAAMAAERGTRTVTLPAAGSISPAMTRTRVDLPEPFSPMTAVRAAPSVQVSPCSSTDSPSGP